MPPRKRRRHPRSLDALFPAPPPRPVRKIYCSRGHVQSQGWHHGKACQRCDYLARLEAEAAAAQLRARSAPPPASVWPGGRVPEVLTMRVVDSGQILRFAIPTHLRAQKRAMDRQRGRRRGARI